jgi:hypothetical protein
MSRRARTHTSLLSLALVFLGVPVWLAMRGSATTTGTVGTGSTVTTVSTSGGTGGAGFTIPDDFQPALIRAGLDPKALAASGIVAGGVIPLLQAAADQMNANPTALPQADTARAAARVLSDQLLRKIQSGLASQEEVAGYQTALADFNAATTQRQTALDAIYNAATANLAEGTKTTLGRIRSNRAQDWSRDYPTEFLVISRQEAEWVTLRDCLANEHIAVKHPDLLSEDDRAKLTAWRADPAVSAAKSALDQNLTAVTNAWNTATGQQPR